MRQWRRRLAWSSGLCGVLLALVLATDPGSWAVQGVQTGIVSAPAPWFWQLNIGQGAAFTWYPAGIVTGLGPSATNISGNQIHCLPFFPSHTGNCDAIEWIQTVGAGPVNCAAAAIYSSDTPTNGLLPLSKVYGDTAAQDCSGTAGSKVSTVNVTLTNGTLYWVCLWFSASTQTRTVTAAALDPNVLGYSSDGSSPRTGYQLLKTFPASFTPTSWPASFSTLGTPSPSANATEPVLLVNFDS